jgi:chorismate dehydratase
MSAKIKTGMRRLRISAISYLNTAPLMWDFEHGEALGASSTFPTRCRRLALARFKPVPPISESSPQPLTRKFPGLMALPGVAIASRRPVRSILLVSRVPVDQIRTVALDTSSMTSVALTKVLFEKWLGGGRMFTPDGAGYRKNAGRARRRTY